MSEVDLEEMETGQDIWLVEKVTTLKNENRDLKRALREMDTMLISQENAEKHDDERYATMEAAITQIALCPTTASRHRETKNLAEQQRRRSQHPLSQLPEGVDDHENRRAVHCAEWRCDPRDGLTHQHAGQGRSEQERVGCQSAEEL